MPVIEIDKLSKFYRRTPGVVELDLSVKEGEIFGFVGPNGAGKSTTIRIMMGYMRPDSGSVKLFGMDAFNEAALIKRDIGYVPGVVNYYHNLKAKNILEIAASFRHKDSRKYMNELCELFEVDLNKPFGKMSVGNRKKVAIVQALMHKPRLLILDEATSGLDVLMRKRLLELLREANMEGTTIFFCGNNLSEVQEICGRTAIIRGGSIIEMQETADFTGDLARKISVRTDDDISSALEVLKIKDVKRMDDYLVFLYDGGMDTLVKALANFRLNDLQISLPSLEDAIFRYYEKKMEREEELFQ